MSNKILLFAVIIGLVLSVIAVTGKQKTVIQLGDMSVEPLEVGGADTGLMWERHTFGETTLVSSDGTTKSIELYHIVQWVEK